MLTMSLIMLWALRLSGHIGSRHTYGKEDYRYVAMREKVWNKWGALAPLISFLHVFALQGLFSMWVNASAIHVMKFAKASDKLARGRRPAPWSGSQAS